MTYIKLQRDGEERYLAWSSIVDAPITYGMTLDELQAYHREEYGRRGMADMPDILARLTHGGTSSRGYTAEAILSCNRAGPNEEQLTDEQIWDQYCVREPEPSRVPVLDHGYVELIETWGSCERIVETARMSTDGAFRGWPKDERLLRYLLANAHTSPFEHAGLTFEVRAPDFVVSQWLRHRTLSPNVESARYTELGADDYLPTVDRLLMDGGMNIQAGSRKGTVLTRMMAEEWLWDLRELHEECQRVYECGLALGVPREIARLAVTKARYSRFRISGNLHNWLRYVRLRDHEHAQWEHREFAKAVAKAICVSFPHVTAARKEIAEK